MISVMHYSVTCTYLATFARVDAIMHPRSLVVTHPTVPKRKRDNSLGHPDSIDLTSGNIETEKSYLIWKHTVFSVGDRFSEHRFLGLMCCKIYGPTPVFPVTINL